MNHQNKKINPLEDNKQRKIEEELDYVLNFIKTLSNIINEFQRKEINKKVRIDKAIRSQSAINCNSKNPARDIKRIQSSINSKIRKINSRNLEPRDFLRPKK